MPVARPPWPDFIPDLPETGRGIISSIRRGIKRSMIAAIDNGWFGLRPLRTHVVVCGFPRSGSTLLLLQAETCVSDARTFGVEVQALAAARSALRNHSYMITKLPWDVFFLDEIRAYYATRRADVRFILTVRDPRAVLTSIYQGVPRDQPGGYFEYPGRWQAFYEHVRYAQQFDDVLTVEYEDLVCQSAEVQRRLTEFIGWEVHLPFDEFHTKASPDFRGGSHDVPSPLNGMRPLDRTRLDAWRQEKHRDRIRQVLRDLPQLPEYLIEMGYESDTRWVQTYLPEASRSTRSGIGPSCR
jgi:hypothetical protein